MEAKEAESKMIPSQDLEKGIYVNNALNRKLGRVGMFYGKDVSEELKKYRAETTASMYKDKEDPTLYIEKRRALHSALVDKAFENKVSGHEIPVATILLGGAGSGKSYVYENYHKSINANAVYVNADDIKASLPEWNKYVEKDFVSAASKLHEESSDITSLILKEAIEERYHFTYDTTLSNQSTARELIDNLRSKGFKINLIAVDVPYDKASISARNRSYKGKRFVPEHVVKHTNRGARESLKMILRESLVDNVTIYDNSGLNLRKAPVKVVGNNTVLDPNRFQNLYKIS